MNPDTIHLTKHVVDRYMERRGWGTLDRAQAEHAIRRLLHRVAHQSPPIFMSKGRDPVRRYIGGGLVWITTSDNLTVLTFYTIGNHPSAKKHRKKMARSGR